MPLQNIVGSRLFSMTVTNGRRTETWCQFRPSLAEATERAQEFAAMMGKRGRVVEVAAYAGPIEHPMRHRTIPA